MTTSCRRHRRPAFPLLFRHIVQFHRHQTSTTTISPRHHHQLQKRERDEKKGKRSSPTPFIVKVVLLHQFTLVAVLGSGISGSLPTRMDLTDERCCTWHEPILPPLLFFSSPPSLFILELLQKVKSVLLLIGCTRRYQVHDLSKYL